MPAPSICSLSLDGPPRLSGAGPIGWGAHGTHGADRYPAHEFWSLHAYSYCADWTIAGVTHALKPGCFSLTPPGNPVTYRYAGPCSHFFVHFQVSPGAEIHLPLLIDAGHRAADLLAWLEKAEAVQETNPGRTAALIWMVLWELAELSGVSTPKSPPQDLAQRAAGILDKRLGAPPLVINLAADLGITARHLQRLFKDRYGCSIRSWLLVRRRERVRTLLTQSELPLGEVAKQVGIHTPQHFNKTVRRLLGTSPRQIRRQR